MANLQATGAITPSGVNAVYIDQLNGTYISATGYELSGRPSGPYTIFTIVLNSGLYAQEFTKIVGGASSDPTGTYSALSGTGTVTVTIFAGAIVTPELVGVMSCQI
jgi:hypothetical protein